MTVRFSGSRAAAKKAMPSVAQLGSVKVVACDGAAQQRTCAVGYERAREFLQEHFYGGRLKRVPGKSCVHAFIWSVALGPLLL